MGTFTLFKGAKDSVTTSGVFDSVKLYLAGSGTAYSLALNGAATQIDDVLYSLTSTDGKTLKLGIAAASPA